MPGKRSVAASADKVESGHTVYTDSAVVSHDIQDIVVDDNEGSVRPSASSRTMKRELCSVPLPPAPVVDASFSILK